MIKNGRETRAEEILATTVTGARAATDELKNIIRYYITLIEAHGEGEVKEFVKTMSIDDVGKIAEEFGDVQQAVREIRDFFHEARRV